MNIDKIEYIRKIKNKFHLNFLIKPLEDLKNLKVIVIGDTIIDEYVFTAPKGRAIKDPILSLDFIRSERYAGGSLAIANHIAGFVDTVNIVTILGDRKRGEDFIKKILSKNIKTKFFTKKNATTTYKQRYIDHLRMGKLFKVEYINDKPIDRELEGEIIDYLKEELPKYDLVVVGDFGHGFINDTIVKALEKYSKFLAVNVQTNSSNMGFNYITKYNKLNYITSNEQEVRLTLADRFGDLEDIIKRLREVVQFRDILLTQGKLGCLYIKDDNTYYGPSLTSDVKDVVGAGDAVFAITSLLNYKNMDEELLVFIANCVGGIAVNIIGSESIKKDNIIEFIEGIYNAVE